MNTKSFMLQVVKVAALSAVAVLNAQSVDLVGRVPMDFKVGGKTAEAGSYRVIEQRPGVVVVKNDRGQNVANVLTPVQTKGNSANNKITFQRKNGGYEFSGYCVEGRGCWSTLGTPGSEKIEIALNR